MRTRTLATVLTALGLLLLLVAQPAAAQRQPRRAVDVIEVNGLVDPVVADFVMDAVAAAERSRSEALVIQIDSGGGILGDERLAELGDRIDDASVPVALWVGPAGARARGQAAVLAAAADVVGLSPRSTVEAAVPGARVPETVQAPTLGDFIVQLDGLELDGRRMSTARIVREDGEQPRRQPTVAVRFTKPGLLARVLHTVASPSVAYLLLVIGLLLVVFEFFTAGVGVAAAVGAGCLVLAGYGVGVLPARWWAVGLVVAAVVGYAVDVQAGAPRFWTVAGTTFLAVGTVRLYDGFSPSVLAMLAGVAGTALFMVAGMPAMTRTRFSTPTIGREAMIGEEGIALTDVTPEGTVQVRGAPWRARTNRATPIQQGEPLRVAAIDGLLLEVEPLDGAARDAGH